MGNLAYAATAADVDRSPLSPDRADAAATPLPASSRERPGRPRTAPGRVPQAAAYRPGGVSGRLPRLTRGWAVKARSRRPRPAPTDSRQHSPPAAVRTRSMRPAGALRPEGASPPRCLAASRRRGRTRPCAGRAPSSGTPWARSRCGGVPFISTSCAQGKRRWGRTTRRSKLDRNPCPRGVHVRLVQRVPCKPVSPIYSRGLRCARDENRGGRAGYRMRQP